MHDGWTTVDKKGISYGVFCSLGRGPPEGVHFNLQWERSCRKAKGRQRLLHLHWGLGNNLKPVQLCRCLRVQRFIHRISPEWITESRGSLVNSVHANEPWWRTATRKSLHEHSRQDLTRQCPLHRALVGNTDKTALDTTLQLWLHTLWLNLSRGRREYIWVITHTRVCEEAPCRAKCMQQTGLQVQAST
jgi:hypothetical protein